MSEGTPQGSPEPEEKAEPATPGRERGVKRRFIRRWGRRGLALVSALVAAVVVTIFSIDLARLPGVDLRRIAEEQATKYLERPAHIGRLSALLAPGEFALDDVVIEGRNPGDRPFMRVGRVTFHVPWWTILQNLRRPDIHVDVHLTDWQMVVESWPGGIHNIPKLTPKNPSKGEKSFTVTVDFAYATGGHFIYEDHGTPWRVDAPNLNFGLVRATSLQQYVGTVGFSGGAVQILAFRPMATALSARFVLDGPKVQLQHIDLTTEGTRSHVNGAINFTRWPEQVYNVNSTIDFAKMGEIFFPNETWRLGGDGQFTGIFRYAKDDGLRELAGDFKSDSASVYDVKFPDLHGSLVWTNTRFAVTHAESDLLGGRTRFKYGLAPLGTPNPATATFEADYSGADLFELDRLMNLHGLRLAGVATGSVALEWENSHFSETRRGDGHTVIAPPAGVDLAPASLPSVPLETTVEPKPFDSTRRPGPLMVGGNIHYQFDPGGVTFEDSWTATPRSYVSYHGRMAKDGSSEFPFHVTSHDWQESDRLLASIITAVSGPSGAVEVGGRGTFDGVMTGSFSSPRIAGRFLGDDLRVWDVTWGHAAADLVIENKYVDITHSLVTGVSDASIVADGHYSLGFRDDEREEIRAKVRLLNWPLADLRHAFLLDDWPMEGTLGLVDLDLRGRYKTMFGTGILRIDNGHAWKEGFEVATGDLELEGTGIRVSRIEMHKSTGIAHGAARVGWDGTYAFNADGEGIPVEKLDNFQSPQAPLTGRLKFKASGASSFEAPIYTFDGSIDDLFVGDEGVGSVTSRLTVTNNVINFERLVAASSRLQMFGTGTMALDANYTSDLRFRFQQTALDPYLKFVMNGDISPYTRMTVGGSMVVRGPITLPQEVLVDTTIDDATLTLSDYDLKNDGPIQLHFENGVARIDKLTLKGSDTNLTLKGGADTKARTLDLSATGTASLSILQLFPSFKTLTVSGATTVNASLSGSFDAPKLLGDALITDGRIRPFGSPHSLEGVNGRLVIGDDRTTGTKAIMLEGLRGRIGTGNVDFGGSISLDGFTPSELNLTATGRSMRLRYPEGFDSTVDMNLLLTGKLSKPTLSGRFDVVKMRLRPQSQTSLFAFCGFDAGALASSAETGGALGPVAPSSESPLTLALTVQAPRMAFVDTKNARVEATADLRVNGTFDQPLIDGEIAIMGGELVCNGNRYYVQRGSVRIPPTGRFEPEFDLAAETRPRLQNLTYVVTVTVTGRMTAAGSQLKLAAASEPSLPETDVISLILGGAVAPGTAELRQLGAAQAQQERMIQSAGATLLASPLTSLVGSVAERSGVLDTVQLTPVLATDPTATQLSPTARVTLGKRISPRVFLTYSRTLSGQQDEVILLEYEQSDRVSWLLSRNEDHTYSLDFQNPVHVLMRRSLLWVVCLCGLILAGSGRAAAAQQLAELLGQTVVSVRFEVEGRPETSAAVAGLSDVRIGQPLRQDDVRATIGHLDSLGRYDDIVSVATPVPGGVDLLFRLMPRHPISRLDVSGETGISAGTLKNLLLQRYGGVPSGIKPAEVQSTAEQFLQDEGYLQARVTARTELVHNPDTTTLILEVDAGGQTRIAHTVVRGSSPLPAEEVMHRTRSSPGEPYRRRDIETAVTALEDTLRSRGFYEAQIELDPTLTDAGMDLTISVTTGPRVELRVTPEGSLPGGVDDLIPIRRLGAADQDLLEDARVRIERLLRADGYWKASAPFTRDLREEGQLLVITFTVTRGPRYIVDHVEWPRDLTLSEVSLREQVNVRDGDVFNEDRFQAGLASLIAEYIQQGYYQATAQPAYEELAGTASGDRARVVLHPNITEGPRGQIHNVLFAFAGAHEFNEATLRQAMQLGVGKPYVALQVAQDRAALITLYRNNGFRAVFLDIVAVPYKTTGHDVTLNVTVNEGRKSVIGQITVVGNQRVSERSILEEMRLRPGQPAGDSVLNDAQHRLADTGNFRRVTLAADQEAGESSTHLIVTVVEAPATTIGYGAGLEVGRYVRTAEDLSQEDYLGFSPRGSFQIGRRNLGGRNRSVDFFSRAALSQRQDPGNPETDGRGFGFTEYRVTGSYRERHPWQSDADLIVSTTFEQAKRTNFNFLRKGVSGELVKPLRPGVTVSGRYALNQTKLFDERITDPRDQSTIDRLFPQVRLSLFSGSLSWDRRDSVGATTRGTFVTAEGEVAARAIGSEVGYAKVFLQGSAFRAVDASRRTVLAGRAELGMAHGFPRVAIDYTEDGTPIPRIVQDLPASQRFYAGGSTTVRGFQQDRLGVSEILTSDGLSNGGNGLVILNGELRRFIGRKLTGVGFADIGNVFASASSLDFTRLRTAVGVGMRYDSPIGPIRLDIGFKVHPQIVGGQILDGQFVGGQRERSWEYHLSIGEVF